MQHEDSHFEISHLLARLIEGTITPEESARLEAWRQESPANEQLYRRMTDPAYIAAQLRDWEDEHHVRTRELLVKKARGTGKIRMFLRYAAAAVVLMLLGGGIVYLLQRDARLSAPAQATEQRNNTPVPRGNVAKLIMSNGNEVLLQGNVLQEFEEADGTRMRNGDSVLRYNAYAAADATPVYHTLKTPKGGEYAVILADGTTAWLNAASSLRFPTHFEGKERVVELSGEAYFEVSGDSRRPFIVKTGRSRVRVLGTAFNVNAYTDMPEERTTLASGAVRVSPLKQGAGVVLQPGYQAKVQPGETVKVSRADMEEALAWKNGLFVFNAASLGEILGQIERWYDVDINCESGMERKFHFTGRIHRYEDITGVLELLEMTGKVKFTLEGRTLSVTPAKARKS
ncbi:FecR family protein [Chitinophaga cymbidii]|uniref:Iron dicitrate transporter FecR n=1 Tax=Chitinophaga cymbidii TaxID=1096750 RepID=A0A512RN04_9BACT|nr:FecR family protein [Chitinophaga cymbidii]GEP97049.1 iron dicitrate transporter FecR [Chitinophaga cymbidii]